MHTVVLAVLTGFPPLPYCLDSCLNAQRCLCGSVTSSQAWCFAQDDVERLQGSLVVEHTLARVGAEKLWKLMRSEPFVPALGALTGNQAMQQIRAGLKAVYCSGWQVCCMPVATVCDAHTWVWAGNVPGRLRDPEVHMKMFTATYCCRWLETPMWQARCTLTRACTPATAFPCLWSASTTPCSAQIRSSTLRAMSRCHCSPAMCGNCK